MASVEESIEERTLLKNIKCLKMIFSAFLNKGNLFPLVSVLFSGIWKQLKQPKNIEKESFLNSAIGCFWKYQNFQNTLEKTPNKTLMWFISDLIYIVT